MLAIDLETTGLNPHTDSIIGISIYGEGIRAFMTVPEFRERDIFNTNLGPFIFHNAKFDLQFFHQASIPVPANIHDTMIMSYLLNPERKSHSLKDLAQDLLQREVVRYEDLVGKGRNKCELLDVPWDRLKTYAIQDAELTYDLYHHLSKQMPANLLQLYTKLELPVMRILTTMEMVGIMIDVPYLKHLQGMTRKQIYDALKQLRRFPHLNYNSPKQLCDLLYKQFHLPVLKKTAKKQPSTDTEVLKTLQHQHEFPKHLLSYREAQKRLSTYIEPLIEEASKHEAEIIYPNFNQCVTATGRLSSSDPINFQNIPKRSEAGRAIRQSFVPRAGNIFIEGDYCQQEARLMAHFSNDPNLLDLFRSGDDIYLQVIKQVFGKAEEAKRPLGKLVFLALGYGAQADKLVRSAKVYHNIDVTEDEMRRLLDTCYATYAEFFKWRQDTITQARTNGYVTTLCGRIRHFTKLRDMDKWVRLAQERECVNSVIQGSAADITKLALLKTANYKPILTVHDSILFEVGGPPLMPEWHKRTIQQEMESVVKLRVPMSVEVKALERWT